MHAAAQEHEHRTERIRSTRRRAQYTAPLVRHLTEVIQPEDGAGSLLVVARMPADDLTFYGYARDEVITLTSTVEAVLGLHAPGFPDHEPGSPGPPPLRCGACRAPWPCATVSAIDNALAYGEAVRSWPRRPPLTGY